MCERKHRVGINGSFSGERLNCDTRDDAGFSFQLFTTDITDLRLGPECDIARFADDPKMSGKAGSDEIIEFADGY